MDKDKLAYEAARPILRPIGFAQLLFVLIFVSTFFIWIWIEWYYIWRIGLTSIIGAILLAILYNFIKKISLESVTEELNKEKTNGKSKFQERLDDLIKERKS